MTARCAQYSLHCCSCCSWPLVLFLCLFFFSLFLRLFTGMVVSLILRCSFSVLLLFFPLFLCSP